MPPASQLDPIMTASNAEILDYMFSMLTQLGELSRARRMEMLTYLIEMGTIEAGDLRRQERQKKMTSGLRAAS